MITWGMCGIAGILSRNPQLVVKERLQQMTKALAHRGPDGEACWINADQQTGFSHCRLAVIDLSPAGAQPMHFQDRYTITYNGEIYNYQELRAEFVQAGYVFRSHTDTEVILAAYDKYGEKCLQLFDGMFSFAIWDDTEKILFAARDRFGEKPFFYFADQQQLLFASEMKALWAAGAPRNANLKMVFNFLTIGYTDNPADTDETFFEGISKLPPASFLKYRLGSHEIIIERYWDIDTGLVDDTIKEDQAIEKFDFLLQQSVKKRLRSDVPVGTSLSGGLNSSAIVSAAYLANAESDSHTCFTATFPGFAKDEMLFAKEVAHKYQLQHFSISPGAEDLLRAFEKLVYHQEEPFGSASVFVQFSVYELARQQGITVLLDGQGADEILAGYHKYYKWYWQELFRKRQLISSGEVPAARKLGVKETFGPKNIIAALLPEFAGIFLEKQYLINALSHEDLTRDFVRLQSREAYYTRPVTDTLNGALYFNTCIHGLEELLRYADRNSMAHGREVRLPFLSHELVEYLFTLPPHFKIHRGWTKWLLRKSVEQELPQNITWRKDKTRFEPPQHSWMNNGMVKDAIWHAKEKLVHHKILRPTVLQKSIQPHGAHAAECFDWRYWSTAAIL